MDTHPLCDQTWQLEVPELYMEAFSAAVDGGFSSMELITQILENHPGSHI